MNFFKIDERVCEKEMCDGVFKQFQGHQAEK